MLRRRPAFCILALLSALLWISIGFGLYEIASPYNVFNRSNRERSVLHVASSEQLLPVPTRINSHIVIAVVSCGMRLHETLNMIKSAIVLNVNRHPLKFVIITEDDLTISFKEKLDDWLLITKNAFTYDVLPLSFPQQNRREWKNLFKPCASQRLFLPDVLKTVDSVLYVDTDTLFMSPVDRIWQLFGQFNDSQIAGLSPEHEDKNVGWYNRFARHPFYGPMGLNSGVMLMNLTRMREFKWVEYILPLYKQYKLKITWGDQDLINILFYYHPDKLYVFPCEWNYRPDHCMYMDVCKTTNGIQVIHGNRGYFHSELQPAFSATYRTFEQYQLGTDLYLNMLLSLELALTDSVVADSHCGRNIDQILYVIRNVIKKSEYYGDYMTNNLPNDLE